MGHLGRGACTFPTCTVIPTCFHQHIEGKIWLFYTKDTLFRLATHTIGKLPKLDCADSMPTYLQTGHLSHQKHSLGIFCSNQFCVIHNYYKLFFIFFFFCQTIFWGGGGGVGWGSIQKKKSPLSRSFMSLKFMLNVYLKPWFLVHEKRTY